MSPVEVADILYGKKIKKQLDFLSVGRDAMVLYSGTDVRT